MEYKMTDTAAIHSFILGGKAIFTIRSQTSGKHWTFTIRQKEEVWFVRLFTSDSETMGVGYITDNRFHPSFPARNTTPRIIIDHLFKYIAAGRLNKNFEFFHVGQCGRCGRPLTDPASIERGLGPYCAKL